MTTPDPALILFDVDGTLVLTGRAGVRGMNLAFERLFGRARALDGVAIAGRTDRAIVTDVLRAIGREGTDDEVRQLREAYCAHLAEEMRRPVADPSGVLPGVHALLDALADSGGLPVGLLTGNFARGAAIKLGHFDLHRRFAFGAYGDDHVDRRDLVPVALAQARAAGLAVRSASQVIVIGDTPLDVECAHAHGARAIGVATGPFSIDQLAGADLVVPTLEDRERIMRWIKKPGGELRSPVQR